MKEARAKTWAQALANYHRLPYYLEHRQISLRHGTGYWRLITAAEALSGSPVWRLSLLRVDPR